MEGGGGTERRFLRLFRYMLGDGGYPLRVVLVSGTMLHDDLTGLGLTYGLEHVELDEASRRLLSSRNPMRFVGPAHRLAKQLRPRLDGDVVVHAAFGFPFHVQLGYELGAPLVYSLKDWKLASGKMSFRQRVFMRWFLGRVDRVDTMYPYALQTFGRWAHKFSVNFSVPIPFEHSSEGPKQKEILFVGRLVPEKAPFLAVRGFAEARARGLDGDWRLIVRGVGPLEQEIRDEVARLGLVEVTEIGACADLSRDMAHASICLKLNTLENIPSQSLLEAMASSCAVVATDVGNTRAWLSDENALLVPGREPDVAQAILRLTSDELLCSTLGKRARVWVEHNSSYSSYAAYYWKLWSSAVGGKQLAV